MKPARILAAVWSFLAVTWLASRPATAVTPSSPSIHRATLGETDTKAPEISTEELRAILASGSATVLDARPFKEYAMSHVPGAANVSAKPGVAPSQYVSDVAEIGRLVGGNHDAPLVLYCNGPHCNKSRRLAAELVAAGYGNVRRYQLGIPVWRALGEECQIELEGVRQVIARDSTAVLIDAREEAAFSKGSLLGARNIPRSRVVDAKDQGEVRAAKDDGRLPMEDHNTRIVVFGADSTQARAVARAIAREAFHNVSFFAGSAEALREALPR
jgi:rhodanese-related sulfurtransferase